MMYTSNEVALRQQIGQIVTTLDKSTFFGMMIACDLTFKFSLGETLKKSNMATIFKMDTRYFK